MNVMFPSKADQLPWCLGAACAMCDGWGPAASSHAGCAQLLQMDRCPALYCLWINRSDVHLVHFSPRYNKNGHGASKSSIVTVNKLTMNVIKLIYHVYQS